MTGLALWEKVNQILESDGSKQRFRINEVGAWVLYPVPADESEWKHFLGILSKAIENLSSELNPPATPTGEFHVKQWVSRIQFRADCPACKGERLFQYTLSPVREVYLWICNTDSHHKHGIKTAELDSEHPDWKKKLLPT